MLGYYSIGSVPEWSNGPDLKSGRPARVSEVRILPLPPLALTGSRDILPVSFSSLLTMRFILSIFSLVLLAACWPKLDDASSSVDSSDMHVEEPPKEQVQQQETVNVSYRGVVEPLGISLYMQGTHRLALEDDRFVFLEGPAVDLNVYLGEEVEVFGAARPTIEAGGIIMRVERINRISPRSAASSEASEFSSSEWSSVVSSALPLSRSSLSSRVSSLRSSVSISSSVSSHSADSTSSRSSASSHSAGSFGGSVEQDAKVATMAKEKFTAEQWTQEYCSSHAGFCVPVHRNWWFKSFGATASSLWHVEISSEPVENLGDGTLLVNLVQGDISGSGAADREVRMHGNFAVGYRSFSENRHFEISAPMDMKEAVQYMTENLK